jgi:hypothetical protein
VLDLSRDIYQILVGNFNWFIFTFSLFDYLIRSFREYPNQSCRDKSIIEDDMSFGVEPMEEFC